MGSWEIKQIKPALWTLGRSIAPVLTWKDEGGQTLRKQQATAKHSKVKRHLENPGNPRKPWNSQS